ncbi:MAG TPA: TadE family protein [Methylophilus sp.]
MMLAISHKQQGVAAVEFALIASVFFAILFGALEMGRVMFYLNTAAEATRLGARVAVVCDQNDSAVTDTMIEMLPILTAENIDVSYLPAGCDVSSCISVNVVIANVSVNTFIPFIPFTITLPDFSTTLPRESMDSTDNSVCT